MSTLRFVSLVSSIVIAGAVASTAIAASGPNLGTPLSPDEVKAWDRSVFPDGRNLPRGRGSAREGRVIFDAQCAPCHGPKGRGATADELAGSTRPLTSDPPDKTIGTYWPYATTLFDFTRRAMPMTAPGSLTPDEVYAVTAYLLFENGIIAEDVEVNEQSLPAIKMPNRDGFDRIDAR